MSVVKTDAFVIKGFRYGETSKIITLYSREYGKFNALVKSTRSVKSKTSGVFDNLNYISVIFNKKENRDLQFISKGECVNSFSKIKSDLDKLNVSYRILELIHNSTHDYDTNEDLFDLLNICLTKVNTCERNSGNFLLFFQANLTKLMGIKPDLVSDNPIINGNRLNSKTETFNPSNALKLNRKDYSIVNSLFERDADFNGNVVMGEEEVERLGNIFDIYLSRHLEKFGYLKTKKIFYELKI